jgi:undecaprenyl-diphosphatase|tara:strand:+ start:155 stop:679 length:525 start_codon:yes stop_codon:yes gene_type:complete
MKREGWFLGFFLLMVISFFFDRKILDVVFSLKSRVLDFFMINLSAYLFLIIFILFCGYLLWNKKKIVYLWAGIGVSYVASYGLKYLIQRPRPESLEFGFPSSHATIYFFMFMFMGEEIEKKLFGKVSVKWIFLGLALLVSFSRLYLGRHYLSDVIGGGLLGAAIYLGYKKWLKN